MTTYTAASVALDVVPDVSGMGRRLDAFFAGYRSPPIPAPDVDPPDIPPPDTSAAEASIEEGLTSAAAVAAVAIGAILGKGIADALNLGEVQSRLAAQLGDQNAIGAERAGAIAGQLYAGAYGASMSEVSDAVSMVIRSGAVAADATDEQIQGVTASVLDLAAAFDVDSVRATEALSAMVRNNLVPNAEAGLDVITKLYQTLGPGADDVLDTFQEYSVQFSKIGIDANMAGGIISQMFAAGARDTDIAADALKEFAIRAIDGSKLTVESYPKIGLNADDMRRRIAAGGPDAAAAMSQVVGALKSVEDPALRAEAATGLFGTQAEDLGAALFAMDPANAVKALGDVGGAAANMGTTLADNSTSRLTAFGRTLELGVASVITDKVLPALDGLIGATQDFLAIPGVPDVLGFIFSAGAGIAVTLGTIAAVTRIWTIAQAALNIVMGLSPITIVVIALGALAGMLIYAYNTSEDFRRIVDGVFAWVGDAAGRFGATFDTTMQSVNTIFGAVGDFFTMVWVDYIKPIFDRFPGVVQTTANSLNTIWDTIKKIFGSPVYFVLETVWNNGIGDLWDKAKAFGLPLGDFPEVNTGGIPHFADGGPVHGSSPHKRADNVPAMLTAGEYVLSVDDVAALGGADVIDSARQYLADGGRVNPVGPQQMLNALIPLVPGVRLTSGLRKGDPGWHGRGLAGDFAGLRSMDTAMMMRINQAIVRGWPGSEEIIYTPGTNIKRGRPHTYSAAVQADHRDHVHWAVPKGAGETSQVGELGAVVSDWFTSQVRGLFDGAAGGVRSLVGGLFPRNGTFVGDLPSNATDWALAKAKDALFGKAAAEDAKAMPTGGGNGGAGVAQWRGVVLQALGLLGLSPSLVDVTLRRMSQESGGNPRAINNWDSNAKRGTPSKGLMQVIDPTFRANYDRRTPFDIWNPLSNVTASMKYALGRYGSLPAAYNKAGGYDQGGAVLPGLTPILNASGRPETLLPFRPEDMRDWMRDGGGRSPLIGSAVINRPVDIDLVAQRLGYLDRAGGM